MKFFVDTADIAQIKEVVSWGICDGVTTNPSLIAKTGKPLAKVVEEICAVVQGPISVEVTALDFEGMMTEARKLAAIKDNIVVKIPLTKAGIQATKACSDAGIATNVTLCFSAAQALIAAKAGASYISPFIGRLDDCGNEGMQIIEDITAIYRNYDFNTEVLVASVRHPIHVVESARLGADVCTVPFDVLDKLFSHPLTDIGLAKFMKDWEKVPK
ncbi:MAG: fructose-6-phosphate aldolase [Myxococcales bacterium]|nr:fructose-6-phosphate aldolase [Myxococcales bacterium]